MRSIVFYIMAAVILVGSVLTVSSSRLLRSAVYLFFVLIATAGIYFLMDYTFLAASQLTLYAGGIIVLIIFSVMLTSSVSERMIPSSLSKRLLALTLSTVGLSLCLSVFLHHNQFPTRTVAADVSVRAIGAHLVSSSDQGYMLPFELISVLLLAAMVAAIIVARRDDKS